MKVGIIELNSMSLNKSKEFMKEISEKAFRGEQLFSYFNRNKNLEVENLLQKSTIQKNICLYLKITI